MLYSLLNLLNSCYSVFGLSLHRVNLRFIFMNLNIPINGITKVELDGRKKNPLFCYNSEIIDINV